MADEGDPFRERKRSTFAQAEGVDPLPTQLQLKEVSPKLRAVLWDVVHTSVEKFTHYEDGYGYIGDPWRGILRYIHIYVDHKMADEFSYGAKDHLQRLKRIFTDGDYVQMFDWLQHVLRFDPPYEFPEQVDQALTWSRAAYRVLDNNTIVPVGSDAELQTLKRAFADLAASEFHGARAHLGNAAELVTGGKWPDSIRESIHAVESVVRMLEPSGDFSKAIAKLEASVNIHGAMKEGFKKLYGYTSDAKGIRHALLDEPIAAADEADALFMLGACAAFISYLINKARAAGLLKPRP